MIRFLTDAKWISSPNKEVHQLQPLHDDSCRIKNDEIKCNCNPTIVLVSPYRMIFESVFAPVNSSNYKKVMRDKEVRELIKNLENLEDGVITLNVSPRYKQLTPEEQARPINVSWKRTDLNLIEEAIK